MAQMQQQNVSAVPAETQQGQVMVRDITTPQAVESFYGSGTEITQPDQNYFQSFAQPDQDYYQEFALPGVQMERPETAEEADARETARQKEQEVQRYAAGGSMSRTRPADEKTTYQRMLEGTYQPDGRARSLGYTSSGAGLLGNPQQSESIEDEDLRFAQSMPILDAAGGQYQPDMRALMQFTGGVGL